MRLFLILLISAFYLGQPAFAQGDNKGHGDSGHSSAKETSTYKEDSHNDMKNVATKDPHHEDDHHCSCSEEVKPSEDGGKYEKYDPAETALHHIADANTWNFFGFYAPLPCILYSKDAGWNIFMSSKFKYGAHTANGTKAIDRYILSHGIVMRIDDESFPMGEVELDCEIHHGEAIYHGQCYTAHDRSVLDGGMVGGGLTSYYDFSLTKNVLTMVLGFILLAWIFISAARGYIKHDKHAPKAFWQRIMEPVYIFMRDEVCKPVIGPKYERFMPFIMSLFFFILVLNLVGQIPFIGNPNVTGNIAFTAVLAIFTLIITSINGNKHYWQHIFNMPGVPAPVKLILTPIEILGIFLKPLTLMVRLFANITAGHIIILSFVGLIFIFGNIGELEWGIGYGGGNIVGMIMAVFLTLFMSAIELLVAFLQAFIFAILSASYIGAAVVDDHH